MVVRGLLVLALSAACLAPGCSKKSSSGGGGAPFVDYYAYFVRNGDLARAFVYNGDWNSGEYLDSLLTQWQYVPHKTLAGSQVTYGYGIRFLVYRKLNGLWMFDTAAPHAPGNPRQISNDANVGSIVAVVDAHQSDTAGTSTYVFFTTVPDSVTSTFSFRVARCDGVSTSPSAALETAVPDTNAFTVAVPRKATDFAFYLMDGGTNALRRVSLAAFPAVAVDDMAGADDPQQFLAVSQTRVVYRSAAGTIRKSDIAAPPVATLYTPGGSETVQLADKIDLGMDSEIFWTSIVTGAPNQLSLRRKMYSDVAATAPTVFDTGTYTTGVTVNRVAFTATRVVWAHVRDTTSYIRSFVRATPATSTDLLTGGRALTAAAIHVFNDAGAWRVLFGESAGATNFRVCKAETGALINTYTFLGAVGPDALNHMGTSFFDIALDLPAAGGTARLMFSDGLNLQTILLTLLPASLVPNGAWPADITVMTPQTSFRPQTCFSGTSTAPAQTEIFYLYAGAPGYLRQTYSPSSEFSIAAH